MRAALKADAGVAAAFGSNTVKVYDVPPVNAVAPYLVIGEDTAPPVAAEGYDGSAPLCTVHVWSLTSPPGLTEAKAIGTAVLTCLAGLAGLPSFRLDHNPDAGDVRYLIDADGRSAHGVIRVGYTASPL